MYNILLCDDEEDILLALRVYLKNEEYNFFEAHNGEEAVEIVKKEHIDLLLLDIMMPKKDGLSVLQEIREFSNIPVILLTAKGESIDKVTGFDQGADDYITKPFEPTDVRNRIKAALRRYIFLGSKVQDDCLRVGGIVMDDKQKKVYVNGEEVALTFSEYEILKLLIQNPGKCYSPAAIYEHIWNENPKGSERTISVHIRHLREKIEINPDEPRVLTAVWGQGYRLVGTETKSWK